MIVTASEQDLTNLSINGKPMDLTQRLVKIRKMIEAGKLPTVEPLLPILLTLKGQPFTLDEHPHFAPMFRVRTPNELTVISARQSGKSQSLAAKIIITANSIPHFAILAVCPLFEQVRRFSNDRVSPFISGSPVKSLWTGTDTDNSVLQRSFKNQSKIYFSYAYTDADRTRGLSVDFCVFDEIQDMDPELIPIIKETMSHSKYGTMYFTGTAKTEDNLIHKRWEKSSQAEWFIKCKACNHWNIPSKEFDLVKMIGPLHTSINAETPALICAKCQRPIHPTEKGCSRWVHRYKDRRWDNCGLHISQPIMPLHCTSYKKWSELLGKMNGAGNTTIGQFYNECLGETYDVATKLINMSDLKAAATLNWKNNPNDYKAQTQMIRNYHFTCVSVDFGGYGEKGTSFTVITVLGWTPNGEIHVIWSKRLLNPNDPIGEAQLCLKVFNAFRANFLAYDHAGAGTLHEAMLNQAGIPADKLIPIVYCRTGSRDLMSVHAATKEHPRSYHILDKARSLKLVCNCIKLKQIKFFQYDYIDSDNAGLLHDFLALIENKVPTAHAGDTYTIIRVETMPDDFAQTVNMGACALWHATQSWPNLSILANMQLTQEQLLATGASTDKTWHNDVMGGYLNRP